MSKLEKALLKGVNEEISKLRNVKSDSRPARWCWAPGNYMCQCVLCGELFWGDKRSFVCADCTYAVKEGQ